MDRQMSDLNNEEQQYVQPSRKPKYEINNSNIKIYVEREPEIKLLFENLYEQRFGAFFDIRITTENRAGCKAVFSAHKYVLAAHSLFFQSCFHSQLSEKTQGSLKLTNTSKDGFQKILDYIYKGEIEVSSEINTIMEFLDNALFFLIRPLMETCTEILGKLINKDTCCNIWIYARSLPGNELTQKCRTFIISHFNSINEIKDFQDISSELIEDLVSAEREYNTLSEESLYSVVKYWILHDFYNREKYIGQLFDEIRFEHLSYFFLILNVLNDDNPLKRSMDYASKIFKVSSRRIVNLTDEVEVYRESSKHLSNIPKLHAICNGKIRRFDCFKNDFEIDITDFKDNFYGYTVFGNDNLFICGGHFTPESSKYYSFSKNNWTNLPDMDTTRMGNRVVSIGNKFYVCGGSMWNQNIEIFDIQQNFWSTGPRSSYYMSDFGLCLNDECIYALNFDAFERLDPREDAWNILPASPVRYFNTIVGYENCIFSFDEMNLHMFDVRNNKWTTIDDFTYIAKFSHSCLLDDKIYLMGGISDHIAVLAEFNPSTLSIDCHLNVMSSHISALFSVNNY